MLAPFDDTMTYSVKDKVIVITGASRGIGAELARQLDAKGAKVALAARSTAKLDALASDLQKALPVTTDVTDQAACQELIEKTVAHFGRVDVVVNNAGMSMLSKFEAVEDFDIFNRMMQLNFMGAVCCTHAALPHLKKTGGLLVGISSLSGKTGVPLRTGYSASKHAMQGFFDSLRVELIGSGVDVSMISLSFVDTEIRENSLAADGTVLGRNPMAGKKMMSVEETAQIIIKAIEKRKREHLMSYKGKLLGLGNLLLPGLVDYFAKRSAEHE